MRCEVQTTNARARVKVPEGFEGRFVLRSTPCRPVVQRSGEGGARSGEGGSGSEEETPFQVLVGRKRKRTAVVGECCPEFVWALIWDAGSHGKLGRWKDVPERGAVVAAEEET